MKNDKGPLSWLKNLFKQTNGEEENKEKKPSKYAYVLTVLLLGVGIMMVSSLLTNKESKNDAVTTFNQTNSQSKEVETFGKAENQFPSVNDYEKYLQNEMKGALESIAGVSDVKVVIYVDASEKKVFEKNKVTQKQETVETDQEGGKREVDDTSIDEQLVILKSGDKEGPIVVETKKPNVSGVLVVAKGAENIQIKKWIIEAVTRALDVPSHRVSVMPKK
ncbi:stage III sporulation protein AG [Peribacillus sp. NPDC096379]|uniref:stage III sporulation protein AG n=1 Tax=Peribacillus sp. NPDC096379 TaxID=3364393 RepID=UPI0037F7F5DF